MGPRPAQLDQGGVRCSETRHGNMLWSSDDCQSSWWKNRSQPWRLGTRRLQDRPDILRCRPFRPKDTGKNLLDKVLFRFTKPTPSKLTQVFQKIHQMHKDAVIQAPPGIDVIASSPRCDVQVMYQRGRVLSFQGHPEFDGDVSMSWLNERYEENLVSQDLYDDAVARVRIDHDGMVVMRAVCEFLFGQIIGGGGGS